MQRIPPWVRRKLPGGEVYFRIRKILRERGLHTVCEEARCPNVSKCWGEGTATFMIMGDICTRKCGFCAVKHGRPMPLDPQEPVKVAEAAAEMGLSYVVITSVTRDDLPDGGASHFLTTVKEVRKALPEAGVEVLIPDFGGREENLEVLLQEPPSVLNHNIEVPFSLYPKIGRPRSFYRRSLGVLEYYGKKGLITKSGIMLGLGEKDEDVREALRDLVNVGVKILTIGQYLRPGFENLPVERYYSPEEFEGWKEIALGMGFLAVESGPLVRSSYRAEELYREVLNLL